MKIRRFNESKEEEFDEYFIDFIDYGFSYENTGNKFILKLNIRNLQPDFNEIYGMYDMVINRLQETKGISKTVFEFKETVINVMVEIKNELVGNTIEVIYKGKNLKLEPTEVRFFTSKDDLYYIGLECYDMDNKKYNITWSVKYGHIHQLRKDNSIIRIGGNNIQIDIENATKIYNIIKDEKVPSDRYLSVFINRITPEILSNI